MVSDTATETARKTRKYGRLPLTHFEPPTPPGEAYPGFSIEQFSKLNFESAVEYILEIIAASYHERLADDEMYPLIISAKSNLTAEIRFLGIDAHYDKLPSDWIIAETGFKVSPSRQSQGERMPTGLQVERSVGGTALARVATCIGP